MTILGRVYTRIVDALALPIVLRGFFSREVGAAYGIGLADKLRLTRRIRSGVRRIPTASSWREHLVMAEAILRVPPSLSGAIVECGCFKGGSTTSLSLVCKLVGRRLIVFDSFEGLPAPDDVDALHRVLGFGTAHSYEAGAFAGSLEEVRANVTAHGEVECCEFVPGFFSDSIPGFDRPVVFAFVDVDLVGSLQDCLVGLWPNLQPGAQLFCHEAHHHEIAQAFFDREWWRERVGIEPPGLIGAGSGLPIQVGSMSGIGYAIKDPESVALTLEEQVFPSAVAVSDLA